MNKLKKQPFESEHLSKLLPRKRHDQNYSVKCSRKKGSIAFISFDLFFIRFLVIFFVLFFVRSFRTNF